MSKSIKNLVQYKRLEELVELEGNPRTITKDKMNKLVQSIKDNPDYFEARPIICSDRTGKLVILAGNQRHRAAKIAGIEEVPTIVLSGLSEEKEKEIIIRDNVELGDWDMDILANEWDIDLLNDWGVGTPAAASGLVEKLKNSEYVAKEDYFIKRPFIVVFYDDMTEQKLAEKLGLEKLEDDTYDAAYL